MHNHQYIAETSSNNLRNNLLLEIAQTPEEFIPELLKFVRLFRQSVMQKIASSQDWKNATNEINNSNIVQQQERKARIKNLFDDWKELDSQEEQNEIL